LLGQCLCGDTAYRVAPPYDRVEVCHCIACRRSNGSALHMVVPVDDGQVEWLGRERIAEFESSPGKMRAFCNRCGSPVYSRRESRPGKLRLRAGLIVDLPLPQTLTQQYGAFALDWIGPLAEMVAVPERDR
jgi:hypothetical protein